jgi:hypothetical protein
MSKEKKAALFLFLVVGVIVLWGALTGWTFSGRLPQEGAKCTPDEGSKDENSDEYIYNADKECLIVNTCKEGWKPNSSNTACISTLSGDTCTGANENGIYKYDTSGECVLDSCVTGFEKSGTECISTLSGDTCTGAVENGIYKYDTSGECVFDSCVTGFEKSGTECISTLSGDTCTGANENGIYKYDTSGECVLDSLSYDVGTPIMCTANDVGSGENRAVYRYMGGVELRHYPNPEIAASWDKKWGDFKKIDCGGLTQGDPMPCKTGAVCSIEYPTGWKHATVSVSKPGFKAYDGFIDSGGNSIAGYRDHFGVNTIEECYKNASPTAKVIGIRTEEHPQGKFKKTCFEYGDGYQTWVDKPFIGKGAHVMTCKDPRKDLKKKEC